MHRRLHQIHSVINEHSYQIQELQARSAHVAQDIQLTAQRQTSQQQEEALRPLRQELHNRLQQGDELETTLSQTQRELQAAEEIQQVKLLHHPVFYLKVCVESK